MRKAAIIIYTDVAVLSGRTSKTIAAPGNRDGASHSIPIRRWAMKKVAVLVVVFLVFAVAGAVFAAEMSGVVKAVDAAKGTITLSSGTVDVPFDCEQPMIANVKVGDKVKVEYTEKEGKKVATKITAEKAPMKNAPVGC